MCVRIYRNQADSVIIIEVGIKSNRFLILVGIVDRAVLFSCNFTAFLESSLVFFDGVL